MRVSYDKETDQLMDIDITRLSNGQMQWIYTMDEEQGERYPNDLQTFLDTKTEIGDLLTLRLPQGYTLGSYLGNVGNYGGALISPKAYDLKIEDSFAPIHWIYAGFAGEAREDMFVFENGKLNPDYFPHSNHSVENTDRNAQRRGHLSHSQCCDLGSAEYQNDCGKQKRDHFPKAVQQLLYRLA